MSIARKAAAASRSDPVCRKRETALCLRFASTVFWGVLPPARILLGTLTTFFLASTTLAFSFLNSEQPLGQCLQIILVGLQLVYHFSLLEGDSKLVG